MIINASMIDDLVLEAEESRVVEVIQVSEMVQLSKGIKY